MAVKKDRTKNVRLASNVILVLIGIGFGIHGGLLEKNIYETGLGVFVFLYGLVALLRAKKIMK